MIRCRQHFIFLKEADLRFKKRERERERGGGGEEGRREGERQAGREMDRGDRSTGGSRMCSRQCVAKDSLALLC